MVVCDVAFDSARVASCLLFDQSPLMPKRIVRVGPISGYIRLSLSLEVDLEFLTNVHLYPIPILLHPSTVMVFIVQARLTVKEGSAKVMEQVVSLPLSPSSTGPLELPSSRADLSVVSLSRLSYLSISTRSQGAPPCSSSRVQDSPGNS